MLFDSGLSMNKEIVLCGAKRTPVGSFQGAFSTVSACDLGAAAIKATLAESAVDVNSVDQVIMGCVLSAGLGQAPARQAALGAGLPRSVQALTVNKVCSSGLKAVMLAASEIAAGNADAIIAGGMENMSQAPYYLDALRSGARLGNSEARDAIISDGLWDPYNNFHMGNAAELCATKFELSRERQDEFAKSSYQRATAAIEAGKFSAEIAPIEVKHRKGSTLVSVDEEPGRGKLEKFPSLRPAFDKAGTVTAANASSINDGAASMLVCSREFADANGLKPVAKLVSQGWHAHEPEWFTTAPVGAAQLALSKAGRSVSDVDLFEINEAFSVVALACGGELGVDMSKLNVNGGAVALGHPIGASGARILVTLLHALTSVGGETGLAAICNGGGEATSVLVERI